MNKIFKTVFNENTNSWVAVPEISKNHKVSTSCTISAFNFSPKLKILSILVANALCVGTVYAQNSCYFDSTNHKFICSSDGTRGNNHYYSGTSGTTDSGGEYVYILGDGNNFNTRARNGESIIAIGRANNVFELDSNPNVPAGKPQTIYGETVAVGFYNAATGTSSVAVGANNIATSNNVYAFGTNNNNIEEGGLAIENHVIKGNLVAEEYPIAADVVTIGRNNNFLTTTDVNSIKRRNGFDGQTVSVGFVNTANAFGSIAIGTQNNDQDYAKEQTGQTTTKKIGNGKYSVAMGYLNNALGDDSIALGHNSTSNANFSIAIGNEAVAGAWDYKVGTTGTGNNTIAIGSSAKAQHENSIAIGSDSQTRDTSSDTAAYQPTLDNDNRHIWSPTKGVVSFGGGDNNNTRRIMGVAAGSADTDAVNVAQLNAALSSSGNYTPITFKTVTGDKEQSFTANSGKTINFQTAEGSSITVALSSDNEGNGTITLGGGSGSLDNAQLQSAIEDYFSTNNIDIQGAIDSATAAETSAKAAKSSADAAKASADDISNKLNKPMLTVIGDKKEGSDDATSFTRTFGETITFTGTGGITTTANDGTVSIGLSDNFAQDAVYAYAQTQDFKDLVKNAAGDNFKSFTVSNGTNTDKFTVETGNTASFLGGNNINATVNKDKQSISFALSNDLTGLNSITFKAPATDPNDPNAVAKPALTISSNGKISNLADGTLAGDAVNKAQLDAIEAKIPTNALTSINNISVGTGNDAKTVNLANNGLTIQGSGEATVSLDKNTLTINVPKSTFTESFKSFTVSGDAVDEKNTTDPANPVKKSFTVDSSTNLAINGSSFITTTADAGTVSINVDKKAFDDAVKNVDGFGGDGIKGIDVKVGGNTVAASQDGKTPASTGLTALNFTNTGNVKATWSGEGDNVGITLSAEGDGVGLESFTVTDSNTNAGKFTVGGTDGKSGLTFTGTGGITTTASDGTVSIGLSKTLTGLTSVSSDKFQVNDKNTWTSNGLTASSATIGSATIGSAVFTPASGSGDNKVDASLAVNSKITNLTAGENPTDAVNKAQLDAIAKTIPTNALTSINNISVGEATTNLVQNGLTIVGSGDASVDLADNTLTIGFNESFKSFTVSGDAEDKTDPANPVKQSFTVDSSTNLAINGSSFIKTTADNGTVSIDVDKDGFDKAVKDAVGDIPDQIKYNGDTNITVDDAKKTISLNDDITVTSLTASSATIGAATFNANGVNMGGKAITNIANATTDTDAVAWGQVKDNLFNGVQMQIDGNDASSLSKNVNLITGDNVQLVWDDDKKGIKISATAAVPSQADITTALNTYAQNTLGGDSFEDALSDINDNLSDINDKINNTTSIPTVTTVSGRKKTANNTNSNMRLLRAPTLKAPTNSDPEIKIYSWAGVDVMRDNDGDYLVHLDFSGIDSETGNTQVVESKLDLALKNELETDGSTLQQAFNTQTASAIKNNDAVKQAINTAVNNAITQDGSSVKATLEKNFATNDALDATNNALDKLTQKVSTIEGLDGDVSNLIDKVDNNYTDLDGKISAVDTKADNLGADVKALGQRADSVDERIDKLENSNFAGSFTVAGDSGESFEVKKDGVININGDGKNISTVASKGNSGAITIKLSDDISVNSVQANSISVGSTQINTNGISVGSTQINNSGINVGSTSISDGAVVVGNGVSLTSEGLNNGYNRIQGVAAGVAPTDAVNVEQLQSLANSVSEYVSNTETRLSQRMDKIEKNSNAAAAAAMASAGLQTAALPGGNSMSISAVTFGGQQGYAIGYMKMSQSGKWGFRAFGNANSRGKYGVGASVGFHWQ